jgi:hypothetical protein
LYRQEKPGRFAFFNRLGAIMFLGVLMLIVPALCMGKREWLATPAYI